MKKCLGILLLTFMCSSILRGQISFSCDYRQYCDWNDDNKKFENCRGYEESSLFVLNKAETMFTHTIETMKSTYYVDSKEYDEQKEVWTYSVTSDVGNKYYYVFDPKNKQVRALYTVEGNSKLIVFSVKAIF
jgi:hypothetical protein